jgi:hypothetical protein
MLNATGRMLNALLAGRWIEDICLLNYQPQVRLIGGQLMVKSSSEKGAVVEITQKCVQVRILKNSMSRPKITLLL